MRPNGAKVGEVAIPRFFPFLIGGVGNNTLGSNGFLHVSSAHNARILQLGAKFFF